MNSPGQVDDGVAPAKLTVRTMPADQSTGDGGCLARFRFGGIDHFGPDQGLHGMTLDVIDGSSMIEEWRVNQPVEHGVHEGIAFSRSGELLLLSWADAIDTQSVRNQSRDIYLKLLNTLTSLGHRYVIKAWNHLPGINEGSGDQERYKQFCLGRAEAMDEALPSQPMPAGTAVGSRTDRPRQILGLASARAPRDP
jgi:chorismate lyase/3-hydroxybenzoate synthase